MGKSNISFILAAMTVCALSSCSFSDEYVDLQEDATTSLAAPVNISLTVKTRAEGDETTEEEIAAKEDSINTGDYKIYFFDNEDHKYLCTFEPDKFVSSTSENGNASYSVAGKLSSEEIDNINTTTGGNFTVVFLANWGNNYPDDGDMTNSTTIADLCTGSNISTSDFTATYSCPTDWTEEGVFDDFYIPFYGVKKFEGKKLTEGEEVDLGDFILLRAVAKVMVVNVTETQTRPQTRTTYYPEIYDVEIVHHNTTGYCAPTDVYTETVYYGTEQNLPTNYYKRDDDGNYYVENLHLVGDKNDTQTTDTKVKMYPQPNDSIWIAYVPEYMNTGISDADTCYITYKVRCFSGDAEKDGDKGEYTSYYDDYYAKTENAHLLRLSFATYENGALPAEPVRHDIKRNKSYRFDVSLPKILDLSHLDDPDDYDHVGDWYVKKK